MAVRYYIEIWNKDVALDVGVQLRNRRLVAFCIYVVDCALHF